MSNQFWIALLLFSIGIIGVGLQYDSSAVRFIGSSYGLISVIVLVTKFMFDKE